MIKSNTIYTPNYWKQVLKYMYMHIHSSITYNN